MSNQNITVVITTFRSDTKIVGCLETINSEINVVIIENSNNPKFKEMIEKKFRNVKCHLAGENLGYAKGNNFGLSKVKTKFALILNPDALLDVNAINNFFITAKKNSNFSIIGPLIQEESNLKNEDNHQTYTLKETSSVKGFAMFLNMEQFKEIGFFDEKFFIYLEEIDLCKRLKKLGKKIFLDSSIKILHSGGSSHDIEVNYEMELSRNWHWMWSSFYFYKKHNGYNFSLIKFLPKLFSSLLKTIFYKLIFSKNKSSIYYQRFSGLFNSMVGKKSWYRPKVNQIN